ncbi:MAG: diaminobutyrate acetyltransferase [Pseudomonadales bacterium]|nr:diaminobutyrate acetyltransferase [Pseudomonadales bacterium]
MPSDRDGRRIHDLVAACPPLDRNSMYCNLLQASHFADTAIVAELDGQLVGCVTGYRLPDDPSVLFVWQVAVSEAGRGRGLAKRMLKALIERFDGDVRHLHTTITPDNEASWALFRGLARDLGAETRHDVLFARDTHFGGAHDDEMLLRIGPMPADDDRLPARRVAGAARR